MKLAALGVVTIGLGVAFTVPGLIGIGAYWVLAGLVARAYRNKLLGPAAEATGTEAATVGTTDTTGVGTGTASRQAARRMVADGRSFALGTALWFAIGIPSVLVGVLEIGIAAEDSDWRWLPIAVGAFALVIGVVGGLLFGAGSAITAAEGVPDTPATLWIRSVRETGTFVNERPRLEFSFHVEPDATTGVAAYDVTKKATVPFTAMGALRVGDGFRARVVGPDKPTSMEIDWSSSVPGTTPAAAPDSGPDGALATATPDVATRLAELERLHQEGTVTDAEYDAQRQRILGSF